MADPKVTALRENPAHDEALRGLGGNGDYLLFQDDGNLPDDLREVLVTLSDLVHSYYPELPTRAEMFGGPEACAKRALLSRLRAITKGLEETDATPQSGS